MRYCLRFGIQCLRIGTSKLLWEFSRCGVYLGSRWWSIDINPTRSTVVHIWLVWFEQTSVNGTLAADPLNRKSGPLDHSRWEKPVKTYVWLHGDLIDVGPRTKSRLSDFWRMSLSFDVLQMSARASHTWDVRLVIWPAVLVTWTATKGENETGQSDVHVGNCGRQIDCVKISPLPTQLHPRTLWWCKLL